MNQSEVARLKEQIEAEITALHLLMHGPAIVSKHELINHTYQHLGCYQQQLARHVGTDAAALFVSMDD